MMNAQADNEGSGRVWLGLALAGLLLTWVAWRVLSLGAAGNLSSEDDRSADPEASSRAAIRAAPLDGRGYRQLAQRAELQGELPRATALFSLAAARGPRDLPSLGWLTRHALA